MKIPIKILIVDEHAIVRNGIISLLEKEINIEVIGEAAHGIEVLRLIQNGLRPDVIITDIEMPEMDGLELTSLVKLNYPEIKVLILTTTDSKNDVIKFFDAGADGYLLKNISIAEVVFAIEQIYTGYKYICSAIGIKLLGHFRSSSSGQQDLKANIQISNREKEILSLIAEGYTNSEIAEKLYTSKRTIEGNRQTLLDKTGKKNTAALINFVVRNGIID
ncbi:response regulator transcription factor [Pedobacter sp. CFBP9032]|uniref:response regulator transcription factor n=1 Tax=Pedobacter sp. CFBP9032 TaxID=3096539 RepID=UPI002A69D9C1|nr:response regulator transcription factor [Pedobacter sp. CFBP9032]MDY0903488.1 response regulator transcription factor [Pedobacter sp. CFBP9032]